MRYRRFGPPVEMMMMMMMITMLRPERELDDS